MPLCGLCQYQSQSVLLCVAASSETAHGLCRVEQCMELPYMVNVEKEIRFRELNYSYPLWLSVLGVVVDVTGIGCVEWVLVRPKRAFYGNSRTHSPKLTDC